MKKPTTSKKGAAVAARQELLRDKGLKATPARVAILGVLEGVKEPATIDEICSMLKDKTINPATVYRTINSLCEEGLVRQIDFRHGHGHYELSSTGDHHHIICTQCGLVEDFTGCYGDKIARAVLKDAKKFSEILDHSLELFGICKKCAKKK